MQMDDLAFDGQPRCPNDRIVMRDVDSGWECPACVRLEMLTRDEAERPLPQEFDKPSIHGG